MKELVFEEGDQSLEIVVGHIDCLALLPQQ
jgi:hypothetical protein